MLSVDLRGRVALVTGAGRGIGRAIALALARCGAAVAVHYGTSTAAAAEVVAQARALGVPAVALQADLRDADATAGLPGRAHGALGRLDVLVNNAAAFSPARLVDTDQALFDELVATNLRAVYLTCRAAVPAMQAQGSGCIVNLASGGGLAPWPGYETSPVYAATKAAIVMFSKRLARELAPAIRVNCVAPGIIDSKPRPLDAATRARLAARIPLGRVGEVDDVANAVLFLASDAACYVTGQTLSVDGGIVML